MGWFSEVKTTTSHPAPSRGATPTAVEALCEALVTFPAEWEQEHLDDEDDAGDHDNWNAIRHSSGAGVAWFTDEDGDTLVNVAPAGSAWFPLSATDSETVGEAIIKNAALRVSGYKPPFVVEEGA